MADQPWFEDHDEWLAQFNEIVNEALNVDPETPLEDADEMAMSDIAAKLAKGKITMLEAIRRTMEWIAGRRGHKVFRDEETWMLEMQVGGLYDVTDGTKVNLLIAGEVGIADAIVRLFADPRLLVAGPGDVASLEEPPTIGVHCKSWFEMGQMSPAECRNFQWAVETALKAKLSEG